MSFILDVNEASGCVLHCLLYYLLTAVIAYKAFYNIEMKI